MCGGGGPETGYKRPGNTRRKKIKKSKIRKIRHAQRIKINGKKKRCVCIDIENEREREEKYLRWVREGGRRSTFVSLSKL